MELSLFRYVLFYIYIILPRYMFSESYLRMITESNMENKLNYLQICAQYFSDD
jgi:hypothetical protein